MINLTQILNGKVVESSTADNAVATATVTAAGSVRHYIRGVWAGFSAAPAAGYKIIQIKFGTTVMLNIEWNPALYTPFDKPFPCDIHGDYNQAVSAELAASGTGGVLGRVKLFVYSH